MTFLFFYLFSSIDINPVRFISGLNNIYDKPTAVKLARMNT
jgi:hypothetical protein